MKTVIKNEKLHQWKSFKQLDLWLWNEAIEHLLVSFCDSFISRLSNIKGIHLVCNDNKYFNKYKIEGKTLLNFVEKVTKHMPQLTQFEVYFRCCNTITNRYLKPIIRQILKNLPHLEVLTLYFNECEGITKECYEAFGFSSRRNLPNLKKLYLCFGKDEGLDFKLNFDVIFPRLEALNLNISGCLCIKDQELANFVSNSLSKLPSLKALTLTLHSFLNLTDKGIKDICSCISKISTLKKLKIDIKDCKKITDKGVKHFASKICQKNTKIRDLAVIFDHNCDSVTDDGIISLTNKIGDNMKDLEKLRLDFSRENKKTKVQVTDKWRKTISSTIAKQSKSLRSFEMNFIGFDELTAWGLDPLIQQIEANKRSLLRVRLYIGWCERIEDDYEKEMDGRFKNWNNNFHFGLEWNGTKYGDFPIHSDD